MNTFDKDEFLQEINSFPYWVENGDDLMKFCKHLQYLLRQNVDMLRWYSKRANLTLEEELEITKLERSYKDAYNNDTSQLMSFKETFCDSVE